MCSSPNWEGLANFNTEKNILSSLLYACTFLSNIPGLNGNEARCCPVLMGMKPAASDWSMISSMRHVEMYNCQGLKHVKFLYIVNTY